MLDVALIGGGPAALAAALYLARAGYSAKIFEKLNFGGMLPLIPELDNYPGFSGEGRILAERMLSQVRALGVEVSYGECTTITKQGDHFQLIVDDEEIMARRVLVATGSAPRTLDFTPEIPVSYCALCDGAFAKDKNVVVVGGANSAVQEALYLAKLARKVTIITHSKLKADSHILAQLTRADNIEVKEQTEPTPELINQFDYCFVYIGRLPATECLQELAKNQPILTSDGYIITEQGSEMPHQTVITGLFAAGDVRQGATKQIVTAAADGAMAAIELSKSLQ